MAITNYERVGKAMEVLKLGLGPFVEREFKSTFKDKALVEATRYIGDDRILAKKPIVEFDAAALLKLMWEAWNDIFRRTLGPAERSLVSELRDLRNKWAHQQTFSGDDAYRALDSAGRLLTAVSATPQADEVEKMKMELLRLRFDEQVRSEKRKTSGTAIESVAAKATDLVGIDAVLQTARVDKLPTAKRVVLVGNKISPGNPVKKSDGTVVRTLWGELAWQLGEAAGGIKEAKDAFKRIQADDEKSTSPGDALRTRLALPIVAMRGPNAYGSEA